MMQMQAFNVHCLEWENSAEFQRFTTTNQHCFRFVSSRVHMRLVKSQANPCDNRGSSVSALHLAITANGFVTIAACYS